jgi:D-alanyl-D-alanine dipeptidase
VALQSEAEEQYLLEEIVVTARSREEPLAEIPVSVSVVEDENRVNSAATTEELLALVRGAALAQTEEEPVRLDTFSAAGEFYDDSISASAVAGIPTPALVNLIDYIPDLVLDIRYFGSNNFVGEPIDGYLAANALLTPQTAQALVIVQQQANAQGLGLKIFDAYRPQRAVNHFVRWAEDLDEQSTKQEYYPNVEKEALFEQGYIAALSGHSRGSTIDLTLINLGDGTELDMGSAFDFFDPISWPSSTEVSEQAQQNRQLLRSLMMEQGFIPYEAEWWHFTLADEPYPDQHFDLLVE